jgi:hypothetical protein
LLSPINGAELLCLFLLCISTFLHLRQPEECSVADLFYLVGTWGFAGCGFIFVWIDMTKGNVNEAIIDGFIAVFFACLAIFFSKIHGHGNWRNGWRKLRRAGGAKAKALKARLVKKLRDAVKPGRPGLKPVPMPA